MNPTTDLTDESWETRSTQARFIGDIFTIISLLCYLSFWLAGALYSIGLRKHVLASLTGLQWLKVKGVALAMAIVGALMRSRFWKIALPVSTVMFFFIMYVMGT